MSVPFNWETVAMSGIPPLYGKTNSAMDKIAQDNATQINQSSRNDLEGFKKMFGVNSRDPALLQYYIDNLDRTGKKVKARMYNSMMGTAASTSTQLSQAIAMTPAKAEDQSRGPSAGYQIGNMMAGMGGQMMGMGVGGIGAKS